MELITKLSGQLKAITYTIRVMCRVGLKAVKVYDNFLVRFLISSVVWSGLEGSFAALIKCWIV